MSVGRLVLTSLVLALAACAAPPRVDPGLSSQTTQQFVRSGRFALRVSEPYQADHAVQGGFVWQDQQDTLMLDLTSPLGATLARIDIQPGEAVLREASGKETRAPSPEALVQQVLGAPVPVSVLRHWVQGRAAPQVPADALQHDASGKLSELTQAGWRVELSHYDGWGPTRLTATRQHHTQTFFLRLVMTP